MLHTRGGRPGRRPSSGFFRSLLATVGGLWSSRSRHQDLTRSRSQGVHLNGPTIAGIVFACLGVGYLLGDAFPLRSDRNLDAQPRPGPRAPEVPGPLHNSGEMSAAEECRKLGSKALLVSFHGSDHRAQAASVGRFLRTQGLDQARIYQIWIDGQSRWLTLVYFGSPEQEALARERLLGITFPPDLGMEHFRNVIAPWPRQWSVD